MAKFKTSDVVTIVDHTEFTDRLAVVVESVEDSEDCEVYLFGCPFDGQKHRMRPDQMKMYGEREPGA